MVKLPYFILNPQVGRDIFPLICGASLYGEGGAELRRQWGGGTILTTALLCANHGHLVHYVTNKATTSYLYVYVCMFV